MGCSAVYYDSFLAETISVSQWTCVLLFSIEELQASRQVGNWTVPELPPYTRNVTLCFLPVCDHCSHTPFVVNVTRFSCASALATTLLFVTGASLQATP